MAGKHIPAVMLIFSLLLLLLLSVVSSGSFSGEYQTQTLVPTLLPARQTESEAFSWDTQDQPQSQYMSNNSLISLSLKLHHVDNLSPAGTTSESLFNTRLQRDARRVFAITRQLRFSSPVISGLKWGSGEYFTRIGVGSPPKFFYMVMDTGSEIIWLQCLPCKKCYDQVGPIFDPNTSTSFRGGVPCKSKICGGNITNCRHNLKRCAYNVSYGDGSFSAGQFATETLTFGRKSTTTEVVIGCGHDNEGVFVASAGLLGLARDKQLSFLAQAGGMFGNKFSYCLANRWPWPNSSKNPPNSSSYLVFGDSPACGKAIYTPLVENPVWDVSYYVGLEGISVGGSRVHGIDASTFRIDPKTGDGGVIVDSGTVVTRLRNETYLALRDAFRKGTKHLKPASKYYFLDTCYHLSGMKEVEVPTVDLHFSGGATMSLPATNYMIPVDNKMRYCFSFAGTADSDGGVSIIGNMNQQGFGMVFDVANNRLGFAPNAC